MSKDPAFLFYSKDWLEGTAEMMPNEKGVYIDLLCYQHQRGDLPNDTKRLARMVGLSADEFSEIWNVIGDKFEANGERTLNRKLCEVMTERKDKGHTNKIIGLFGGLCKKSALNFDQLAPVRKDFKVADFKQYTSDEVSERLSEWFNKRIALLEDANEDEDVVKDYKGVPQKKSAIPTLEQFIDYGLEQATKHRLNVTRTSLSMKYEAWVNNDWKSGTGVDLSKNWKSSLINTLKYIQETENGKPKEYQSEKDMQAAQIMKELKRQALEESLYGSTTETNKRIGDK